MFQYGGSDLVLVGAGTILTSMIAAGFLLGYAVDVWLGTLPVFMLAFGALGLVGGFIRLHKLLIRNG
jgi:ATP synthase protein I